MKKLIFTLILFINIIGGASAQNNGTTAKDSTAAANKTNAKKLADANITTADAIVNTADLNGVTFGFGAGYNYTFDKTYDYSLTTDGTHSLKLQQLNRGAFVISSVLMVKLGRIFVDPDNNTLAPLSKKAHYITDKQTGKTNDDNIAGFSDRLSINLAINLADISSNPSFNKSVNGGIGLGYFVTDNVQFSLSYDISQVSQMRDYIVNTYQDKPIPNGTGTNYTSLSTADSNLFYNKTISGLSFKLVFSIGNQKPTSSTPPK